MVTNFVLDSVNAGLTKVFKDLATTYNLDFKELCDRYITTPVVKKQKRAGHVSTYNMFLKEHRTELTNTNPDMTFAEVARQVGIDWKKLSSDAKKKLESRRDEYILHKNNAVNAPVEEEVPVAVVSQSKSSNKSKGKGKGKGKSKGKAVKA